MKKVLFLFSLFSMLPLVHAENPLEFREYPQTFTLTFPTEQDAQNAVLIPKVLPAEYKLAFSSRWDDSAPAHLKTHAVMQKHHIKGTFFLGDCTWVLKKNPNYVAELQKDGCTIGLHTITHPQLPGQDPNEHFREYMRNRILLETEAQAPVNAQVLPFCDWNGPDPKIAQSIGWAMRATGVISAPDVLYPAREKDLGYPPKSFAQSRVLTPGDRNPDLKKLEQQLTSALRNKKALAIQPSISMSMHSWHTKEGLVNLDKAYARLANNPEWWYCNQNEYGAYRYEAQNVSVTKKVRGKQAEFTVTRMQPIELGARVPLWFSIEKAKAVGVSGAKLHGNSVELPHDDAQTLPAVFGRTDANGKSREIPFVSLILKHSAPKTWDAVLKTLDGKPVEQLAFTFRFPSPWEKEVIRKDVGTTADTTVSVTQKSGKTALYYRYGKPYYAVQADFVRDGKRYRLYADLQEMAEKNLPMTVQEAAAFFHLPEKADLADLSRPSADLSGLTPGVRKRAGSVGTGVLYPENDRRKSPGYVAVVDFKLRKPGKLILQSSAASQWMKTEVWMNGRKISFPKQNQSVELSPLDGANRIVLRSPQTRVHFLFLNGETDACVDFLPLNGAVKQKTGGRP